MLAGAVVQEGERKALAYAAVEHVGQMLKLLEDVLIAQFTIFVHVKVLDLLVLMVVAVLEVVLDGFSDVFYSPLLVELGLKIWHKQLYVIPRIYEEVLYLFRHNSINWY